MQLLFTPDLLQAIQQRIETSELLQDGRFHRVLKLTVEEAKDLVKEAMQARGWHDLALLLDESVADAIREDVIEIRFESGRFSDRDVEGFDADNVSYGLPEWIKVVDEEADIAVMAVVLDHLRGLLGDKDEVSLVVPMPKGAGDGR